MTALAIADTAAIPSIPEASREDRFNELVSVYMDDLYRYGHWLTGNAAVADDLVQETMVRAWKSLHKLQNPKAVKGWLITILRRENARRFERYQPKESGIPTEQLADGHRDYDTSTEAFVLRGAMQRLAEAYREPLLMQVIYGFSQKEIAAQLGISVAGAGTRLFRARQKLRQLLEEGDTNVPDALCA